MTKFASWNVNSLKVRLPHVLSWLERESPDVLALQETKVRDEAFPEEEIKSLGYNVVYAGQKTYNGVAVISKTPITNVVTDIDGLDDYQRRIMACETQNVRFINLYVPNGGEVGSEKYEYKLNWLLYVGRFLEQELKVYKDVMVVGDFNIAPHDIDVHDPQKWEGSVLVSPKEREFFQQILGLGYKDSYRELHPDTQEFSWWDYRMASFRRNLGLRIDHILLSENLMKSCVQSEIDKAERKAERPSDHAPVWVEVAQK